MVPKSVSTTLIALLAGCDYLKSISEPHDTADSGWGSDYTEPPDPTEVCGDLATTSFATEVVERGDCQLHIDSLRASEADFVRGGSYCVVGTYSYEYLSSGYNYAELSLSFPDVSRADGSAVVSSSATETYAGSTVEGELSFGILLSISALSPSPQSCIQLDASIVGTSTADCSTQVCFE